jgi:Na+/phosphate symporter
LPPKIQHIAGSLLSLYFFVSAIVLIKSSAGRLGDFLASSGVLLADFYILPYILGANIGTCFSVLLAALATGNPLAMGVWLVQLTINVVGAVIFMALLVPFSKVVRLTAEKVAASPRLTLIITAVFHLIPTSVILFYLLT